MFSSLKKTQKGFTLIELLVVIAIIAILSSVVLASLSTARQKSRDAKRISDVGQIQLALELFFDANQSYPSTTPNIASTAQIEGGIERLVNATFLPKAPVPPAGASPKYLYRGVEQGGAECISTNACMSYIVAVTLERPDSSVLATDADQTGSSGGALSAWGNYTATPGSGAAGGKIYGELPACESTTAGTEQCYDLKP